MKENRTNQKVIISHLTKTRILNRSFLIKCGICIAAILVIARFGMAVMNKDVHNELSEFVYSIFYVVGFICLIIGIVLFSILIISYTISFINYLLKIFHEK